jgi:hypothetical protein
MLAMGIAIFGTLRFIPRIAIGLSGVITMFKSPVN